MNARHRQAAFTYLAVLLTSFVLLCGCDGGDTGETATLQDSSAVAAGGETVLNPNLAGADELSALPGMNPELVQAILRQRPFLGMEALHAVVMEHRGPEEASELYARMFIPINLNSSSNEEMLLVPGVGDRMAHEFEEYRPYRGIAQWRREMSKYVDDAEVARMEQYVFVPIDLNTATEEEILAVPGVGERMAHKFEEYRPYSSMEQFRREIGKYVDDTEVARLERYVEIRP